MPSIRMSVCSDMIRLTAVIWLLFVLGCSKPEPAVPPTSKQPPNRRVQIANADSQRPEAPGPSAEEKFAEASRQETDGQLQRQRVAEEVANQAVRAAEQVDVAALTARARQGDAQSMVTLGSLHFEGKQVTKNIDQARYWWSEAARKGNAVAVQNLGLLKKPEADGKSTSFLGLESKGHRFVFIIDKSSSMLLGGRFDAARAELIKTLRSLPATAVFMIYFFDNGAEAMPVPQMLPANKENIEWACRWVSNRILGGGTDPSQALTWAFGLEPDTIWLLSDGEFSPDSARVAASKNQQQKVRIHTIAFHDDSGKMLLEQIAKENGGKFRFVP